MRNLTGWAVVFLSSIAAANATPTVPAVTPEMTTQATQGQGGVPAAKGRLKFKTSGPVCMCAGGMSERDIEQALAKFKQGKVAGPNSGVSRSQDSSQEKNLNQGVTK